MTSRWKIAGVGLGTVAVIASSTAAYACLPGSGSSSAAPRTVAATSVAEFDDHVGAAVTEHELTELSALVAAVRAKVTAFGTPSRLTPRQAWKIKRTLAFVELLQAKLAALPAVDPSTSDALAASLQGLKTRLTSVLANATVATPSATKPDPSLRLRPWFADFGRRDIRHVCDHSGDGTYWRFRHHDGDRR